jgi:two-component system, LytTR family, response regulator
LAMNMRTVFVDDEPLARRRIRSLLSSVPEADVVGECGDGRAAIKTILEAKPDLVFLDVQMPGIDGFGVLQAVCAEFVPLVIFVTAFDQYAVRAFDLHALDYLLKPFKRQRFFEAVARAQTKLAGHDSERYRQIPDLLRELNRPSEIIPVRVQGRIVVLRAGQIDWIEAAANQVRIQAGGRPYLVRGTIGSFEQRLSPGLFLRIHRSLIVNTDRIRELHPCNGSEYIVILHDGKELPVGRTYRENIDRFLNSSS